MQTGRQITCPACGHHVAVSFFLAEQPLATLAWPDSAEAAQAMEQLSLDFVRCVDCGHIYNAAFDYAKVPYSDKPNLMFNRGALWSGFLREVQQSLIAALPESPVVVEIGHGDGSFLAGLAELAPQGRFIGFDPNGAAEGDGAVELRAELFEPAADLPALRPDLIISRHVLEHLTNPLGFLQQLAFGAAQSGLHPLVYLEVPCVDRLLETERTVDLYYEHSSQFTTESFSRMLSRATDDVSEVGHGYDGEVVFGVARLGNHQAQARRAAAAQRFLTASARSDAVIRAQLAALQGAGYRIAVWGGTGKSAAFINRYGLDAERFPLVVDSDRDKAGTHVPGTGQGIRYRDCLRDDPVDVVLVPPQWRAHDIVDEMAEAGIEVESVLIEHGGQLIDFRQDPHPYRRPEATELSLDSEDEEEAAPPQRSLG